ncbi:S-layer homology domain-containing protein [Tumebacillus lipolyticus]|uniref:S-layer homology domain-containing protein n=1 Tax=Tumebacillus lipolyticus TaxID=1280370 RepID=A0ABW4ZXU4_9BACL
MNRLNWKSCTALITTIALVDVLVSPMGNAASAAAGQPGDGRVPEVGTLRVGSPYAVMNAAALPEIITPSVVRDAINLFFSEEMDGSKSLESQDFVVKVDGQVVQVTAISPLIDPDLKLTFAFLFLERPVVKGETVTLQYIKEDNPITDLSGDPLSTAEAAVANDTPGVFQEPPVIDLPSKVKYKPKAGDQLVTFRPTSGNANRIQFTFPNQAGNSAWLETNQTLHKKSDYVILNNTDSVSYTPQALMVNESMSMIDMILPAGVFLEEGKSYTIAMSSTASGNEVRLPATPTTTGEAWLTLFREVEGLKIIDEYRFYNLVLDQPPNVPPTPAANLTATIERGAPAVSFDPSQLATDEDDDPLTLSTPASDDSSVATVSIDSNRLVVQPQGIGQTEVRVEVSDGQLHTVTVTLQVEVKQPVTPAISPDAIQIAPNGDGSYSLKIDEVAADAVVKVYELAANGSPIQTKQQGQANGPLTLQFVRGIEMTKVYVTLTDTVADRAESVRTGVDIPITDLQPLTDAIEAAQSKHDNAVEGAADGQYAQGSKAILQAAIGAAQAVQINPLATQGQINAAVTALQEAVAAFEAQKVRVEKAWLSAAIVNAQSLHDDAVEGGAPGEYPVGSKAILQAAIDAAKAVKNDALATQEQVDAALTALYDATDEFVMKEVPIDMTELERVFDLARTLHMQAKEGAAPGEYPVGSKAILQAAIDAAGALFDTPLVTQKKVNLAVAALQEAITAFEKKKIGIGDGGNPNSYTLDVYSDREWIGSLTVQRTLGQDGRRKDALELSEAFVRMAITKLKAAGKDKLEIVWPASKSDASELVVALPQGTANALATGGIALDLRTKDADLLLPSASLQGGKESVTLRVSPLRDDASRASMSKRAEASPTVLLTAGSGSVAVIGDPVPIETNLLTLPNGKATLTLPIDDAAGNEDVGVYIEYKDGTKELTRGRIVAADGNAKAITLQVDVAKLGILALVRVSGWSAFEGGARAAYISGYPGGLFKPNASTTRAEVAAIFARFFGAKASGGETTFTDVSATMWAADAIRFTSARGVMKGYPDGTFRPDQPITRAEMAVLLTAFRKGGDAVQNGSGFVDTEGHWAADAICWAQAVGLLSGYPDGAFRPEQALSRAEAVVILNKLFDLKPTAAGAAMYADVPSSHWAFEAIQSAASGTSK